MEINKEKLGRFFVIIIAFIIMLIPILWHIFKSEGEWAMFVSGKTSVSRIEFLKSYGWEVSSNVTEEIIIIPPQFNEIYKNYNEMQKQQGFDLSNFKGKTVTKYTYEVINYPKSASDEYAPNVFANLLVYEDKIIGGDICSMELDGFLHGFNLP